MGIQIWAQVAEVGWWVLGARVAVGILRLIVVLEGRPRETQIVADLLAGAIYTATALSVVNFVFEVPIGGLIATSGVIAIVLGLALQSTLSDVFSGIAMGLEHAYKPGDSLWVEGGIEGQVVTDQLALHTDLDIAQQHRGHPEQRDRQVAPGKPQCADTDAQCVADDQHRCSSGPASLRRRAEGGGSGLPRSPGVTQARGELHGAAAGRKSVSGALHRRHEPRH